VWGQVPPRNKNFTGREDLLDQLTASLDGQVTAVLPHALHGGGGVGKTQVAIEYAYRKAPSYDVVWWIPADQPSLILGALAGLTPHLGLRPATATGIKDAADAVLESLRRGEPYERWLLIFDNADQPEDLKEFLPKGRGHTLITSRNQRWQGVVETITVDVFSRSESVEFLAKRVSRAITGQAANRLAKELGDLPLALEQAGALQAETGMSVDEYLGLLAEKTRELLAEGKPSEYPVSMTAAWRLSVTKLNDIQPDALELLRCCAFFGPEPIPRDVFRRGIAPTGPALGAILSDPIRLTRIIRALGRYALAVVDPSARTIQVHRLIQALVRDDIPADERAKLRHDVHLLLAGAAPAQSSDQSRWPEFAALVPHLVPAQVQVCRTPEVRAFALTMLRYLNNSGDYPAARTFGELFIKQWTADSGEDHPDVLTAQWHLSDTLRYLGEYQASYEVIRPAVERARQVLGPAHETSLALAMGLGASLRARGDFPAARAIDTETVEFCRAELGPTAGRTLLAQNSLALDYGLASDYKRARDLHKSTYAEQSKASTGVTKANVLASWISMSRAVRLSGEYAEARFLAEDAYEFSRQELGADHPWTLRAGRELAIALRHTEATSDSLALARDVVARTGNFYGVIHPDSLAAAIALANTLRVRGGTEEIEEATAVTTQALIRYPTVFTPDHPYVHACAGNLAVLHRLRGDAAAARDLNQRSLDALHERLGRDHDYALTVAINLASDLAALGEVRQARELGEDTLARLRQVLGEEHPVTAGTAVNLALDLRADGAQAEADVLAADAAGRLAQSPGEEHPDTRAAQLGQRLNFDFDPPPI
jgi:tetratricopeptide (TPR) repeat protein